MNHFIFSQTALWQPVSPQYIQKETQVHLFVPANSSDTVKDLLQRHSVTHEYVALSDLSLNIAFSRIWNHLCSFVFRLLLANADELIEMQTRNDSTDPRGGSTFYERYHNLEDVCKHF